MYFELGDFFSLNSILYFVFLPGDCEEETIKDAVNN